MNSARDVPPEINGLHLVVVVVIVVVVVVVVVVVHLDVDTGKKELNR